LTWQQRLRAIRDAARALAYLHARTDDKPVMLHRDIKPANILLDAQLNAKLADVGLACTAPTLGHAGQTHLSTQNVVGSPAFIDPLYMGTGQYSEITDGYALGISLLVCLTARPAVGLLEACADALEEPTPEIIATTYDTSAAWPPDVAVALTRVVIGLSWARTRARRMTVANALTALEQAADLGGVRPGLSVVGPQLVQTCAPCSPFQSCPDPALSSLPEPSRPRTPQHPCVLNPR